MTASDQQPWTVLRVLTWTAERFAQQGIASPRVDAEVLLAHCLGVERIRLYVDYAKPLSPEERAAFRALVRRRLAREPVAYITGKREFWSMTLAVTPAVLIPRPETELLVERALARIPRGEPRLVVDLGTGSGAVALALAKERPECTVWALDRSAEALELARRNAETLKLPVSFARGDLLQALPEGLGPQLVAANLPYISRAELAALEPEVRRFEPRAALEAGEDGLDAIRRAVPQALARLCPGGALLLEIGATQADAVSKLLSAAGFSGVTAHRDLAGLPRLVEGQKPGLGPKAVE